MMFKYILLIVTSIILCSLIISTNGECCYSVFKCSEPKDHPAKRCADCEEASYYCGVGSCNVFGCNCDNGCRKGNPELWCWNEKFCKNISSTIVEPAVLANGNDDRLNANHGNIKTLIEKYDLNEDKQFDREEFKQLLMEIFPKQQLLKINVDEEFAKLDQNGNNYITINEIDSDLNF